MKITAEVNEKKLVCDVNINGEKVTLKLDDFVLDAEIQQLEPQIYLVKHNNRIYEALVTKKTKNEFTVNINGQEFVVNIADRRDLSKSNSSQTDSGSVELKAKMPGKVVKVLRQIGDEVQAGEGILIIEAMKMQNELSSPKNGKIIDLPVADGATVAAGQKLVVIA